MPTPQEIADQVYSELVSSGVVPRDWHRRARRRCRELAGSLQDAVAAFALLASRIVRGLESGALREE